MHEPMSGLRLNMQFLDRRPFGCFEVNAQDQVLIARPGIVRALLLARQIPMRIQPVRIARGQQQMLRAVRLRQLAFVLECFHRRARPKGVTLSGPAHRRRLRPLGLQQNRGNVSRRFARGPGGLSFSGGFFGLPRSLRFCGFSRSRFGGGALAHDAFARGFAGRRLRRCTHGGGLGRCDG